MRSIQKIPENKATFKQQPKNGQSLESKMLYLFGSLAISPL